VDADCSPGVVSVSDSRPGSEIAQSFDKVFRREGVEIVRTPFRAPQANGVAERFVRTVRTECLDWMLILNERHLERVLAVFVNHYNRVSYCPTRLCA
jgi:transposase InsO family protein